MNKETQLPLEGLIQLEGEIKKLSSTIVKRKDLPNEFFKRDNMKNDVFRKILESSIMHRLSLGDKYKTLDNELQGRLPNLSNYMRDNMYQTASEVFINFVNKRQLQLCKTFARLVRLYLEADIHNLNEDELKRLCVVYNKVQKAKITLLRVYETLIDPHTFTTKPMAKMKGNIEVIVEFIDTFLEGEINYTNYYLTTKDLKDSENLIKVCELEIINMYALLTKQSVECSVEPAKAESEQFEQMLQTLSSH